MNSDLKKIILVLFRQLSFLMHINKVNYYTIYSSIKKGNRVVGPNDINNVSMIFLVSEIFSKQPIVIRAEMAMEEFFFRMRNLIWTFVFQACRICLINFSPWRIFQNHSDPSHILLGFRFGAFVLECCWLYNFILFYFFGRAFSWFYHLVYFYENMFISNLLFLESFYTFYILSWFFAFFPFCIVSFVIFCPLCFPILFHQVIQFWFSMNLSGLF